MLEVLDLLLENAKKREIGSTINIDNKNIIVNGLLKLMAFIYQNIFIAILIMIIIPVNILLRAIIAMIIGIVVPLIVAGIIYQIN